MTTFFRAYSFVLLAALSSTLLVACSDDDQSSGPDEAEGGAGAGGGSDTPEQAPAYLVSREVVTGSGASETVISILADTSEQQVQENVGVTVPGFSTALAELGYVFATNAEELSLTRYEVSDDHALVNPETISFTNYDSIGTVYVFSKDRGYMITGDGVLVVWNPTTMEIEEDFVLDGFERDGAIGATVTGRDAQVAINESARQTGYLNLPITWNDWTAVTVQPVLAILSISTTDASDQKLSISDCSAQSQWVVNGRDDNLYVMGSPAWGPFYHHGVDVPSSAFARFDTSSREFDESFCQSVPELTGGDQGGIALQYGKGQFLLRAIDEATAAATEADGYFGGIASACSFYRGDIDEDGALTLTETPGMGVNGSCFGGFYSVDDDPYFSIPEEDGTTHHLSRWDGTKLIATIELTGFPQSFERVR